MTLFIIGLALFFIPHFYSALRSREDGKDIRVRVGYAKYMGLYSLLTLAGLALMIYGYIQIPDGPSLYTGPHSLHHYSWVFMIPALIIVIAANMPTGHIKRTVQHPLMIGTLIWALFHLATGGDMKRILLFGAFAAYAIVSLACAFKRGTNLKDTPAKPLGDVLAIAIGLGLSALLIHGGHVFLFGASAV